MNFLANSIMYSLKLPKNQPKAEESSKIALHSPLLYMLHLALRKSLVHEAVSQDLLLGSLHNIFGTKSAGVVHEARLYGWGSRVMSPAEWQERPYTTGGCGSLRVPGMLEYCNP